MYSDTFFECHLEGMLMEGEAIPEAQSIEVHQKNKDFAGGARALVTVDLSKLASKATRINMTLLARVDEQARREGDGRSGILGRAVVDFIGRGEVG